MKKRLSLTITFICLLSISTFSQSFKVATYNIRLNTKADSLDAWPYRSQVVSDMIRFHDFDVFGVQEALKNQMDDLSAMLSDYSFTGVGRDDGKQKGEFSAIFYKKDRFKLLDAGTFWLSGTDTEKPNKGWDAAFPRICTWAKLQDKASKKVFFHFNTHFDHKGVEARKQSASLILARISKIAGNAPVIFSGDLNVNQTNESYKLLNTSGLLKDAYDLAPIKLANNGTFNGFDIKRSSTMRIDHIFLSNKLKALRYGILTDSYQGRAPSDHYPILVEVGF